MNLSNFFIAVAIASTMLSYPDTPNEDIKVNYIIGGKNVIYSGAVHGFEPGDSKFDIALRLSIDEHNRAVQRDLVARERNESERNGKVRGGSFTGTGYGVEEIGYSKEQCVTYAKRITGIQHTICNGGRCGIQGTEPRVGAIGVEKRRIHAVVIEKIEGEEITVTEANFHYGRITRRRLRLSDFIGFIYS